MRRFAATLLVAVLSIGAEAATLPEVQQAGILRVGTTGDYKPFAFREEDGSYHGADIVMAEHLATALGVKLVFVPTSWAALDGDFAAGKFDVAVGGVTILPAREKIAAFSPPMLTDGKRPVVRCADKDRYPSVDAIDRPGVRVVVNPGASNEAFARAHLTHAQLTVHPDNATVFNEIVAGREDVMVTDGIEVDHQAFLHPELCAAAVPAPFTRLQKAFMLPKDPAFVAAVARWWAGEESSGDWMRVLEAAERAP